FQIGSEGRREGLARRLARLAVSPFALAHTLLSAQAALLHINTSLNAKACWRDLVYLAVTKLCGARVLYQVHGGQLDEFAGARGVFGVLLRAGVRLADAVVVLSRAQQDAFRAHLPRRPVDVVPNGIDCAPYTRHPRAASDPTAPLRLIYFGR